jgi:pimeloyl-ACP methyl ester carboxylesterase
MAAPLDASTHGFPLSEYGPGEDEARERTLRFLAEGLGYATIQGTRPQTLTYGMNDSPAGLCSWFLEKRRDWSDSQGNVERVFTRDELLTGMTLYWITESFGTAARLYYEGSHNPWQKSHERTPVVEAPTALAIQPRDVLQLSRSWTERYYNLKRWTVFPAGGHFAHMEQPQLLVEDIRAFFRTLR